MAISTGSLYVPSIVALGASLFLCGTAEAHFVLTSPEAMYQQSGLGDPQKAPPCGDDGTAVPSGMVTGPFQAGETITITIEETIPHPGHFRIALAIDDPSQLPPEPPVTAGNTDCGSVPIDPAPVFPVLADGVLVHTEGLEGPQDIDVTLPDDISCNNCTLQIIQFMSNHGLNDPGGCFYHHCAVISVEGGAATTASDSGGSTDDGPSTVTNATATEDDGGSTEASAGDTSEGGVGDTTGAAGDDGTGTGAISATDPGEENEDGGCSCSQPDRGGRVGMLLGLVGLMWLGVRRRARG